MKENRTNEGNNVIPGMSLGKAIATIVILLILALAVILTAFSFDNSGARVIENGTIKRDITGILKKFDEEPNLEERRLAWNSELPKFVSEDIQYILEHEELEDIEYTFSKWTLHIWINGEGIPIMELLHSESYTLFYDMEEFSMYRDGSKLVVYAIENSSFVKYSFDEDEGIDYEYITYNISLPFEESKAYAIKRGDYLLCFSGNQVYVYNKSGDIVSPKYDVGKTMNVWNNGVFITEDRHLKVAHLIINGENDTEIRIKEIAEKIQYDNWRDYKSIVIDEVYVPIFQKDNEWYALVPSDWEMYFRIIKGEVLDNSDYTIDFVKIDGDMFKSAKFHYQTDYSTKGFWIADMTFEIGGKEAVYGIQFRGYDTRVECPKELPQEMVANSLEEYEETIMLIREAYEKYYNPYSID